MSGSETWIVTGGAGFIGSNFVRKALSHESLRVVVFDKLTYSGNLESLADVAAKGGYVFRRGDIRDREAVRALYRDFRPTAVLNFAAESHVDRSIDDPSSFVETNVNGTFELLEGARQYLKAFPSSRFRFLHVSTDEVYGSLGTSGFFTEETPYAPNSPYSATKAGADHLVRAYHETYGLPVLLTNCSNNYGPFQFPEKLIPLVILNALEGKALPIYGDGGNVRDWLYVEDHCDGIVRVLEAGAVGGKYNIGGNNERTNLEVVERICEVLDRERPVHTNPALSLRGLSRYRDLMTFVPDRPGHDRRYAIDASRISRELGFSPKHDFESGLDETVRWYLANSAWCEAVQKGKAARERQGVLPTGAEAPEAEAALVPSRAAR